MRVLCKLFTVVADTTQPFFKNKNSLQGTCFV